MKILKKDSSNFNFLYPLGFFGIMFINTIFTQWIVYFHLPPDDLSANQDSIIGTILFVAFFVMAITNPLAGFISDNINTRLGKRRPFILLGTLPLVISFILIWVFKDKWLSSILILFYSAMFILVIQPFSSMLPIVAPTEKLRTKYTITGTFLAFIASGVAMIGSPYILKNFSFITLGTTGALVFIMTVFLPVLFIDEGKTDQVKGNADFKNLPRQFIYFMFGNGLLTMVVTSLTILVPFISEALLVKDKSYTALLNSYLFSGTTFFLIIFTIFQKKIDYHSLYTKSTLVTIFLLPLLGLYSSFSDLSLSFLFFPVTFFLEGLPVLAALMTPFLIIAKFSEEDGNRRTGVFFGINGFAINIANAFGSKITTLLLTQGKNAGNPKGVIYTLFFVAAVSIIGFFFLSKSERRRQI